MYMTIRERARNKIWSRIITKHIQIEDVRKDLEKGNFGIITEEEMRSMFNGLKTDLKVYDYIYKLIETRDDSEDWQNTNNI